MGLVFVSIQPVYVFCSEHLIHLHLRYIYQCVCSYCHFVNCFGFVLVGLSSLPLSFSCDLMTNFSVMFGFLFLLCVCLSIVDFWFAVIMRFRYSHLCIIKIVVSCWSFNFRCIFNILRLCSPLLTIAGFDIIFVCRCFPTFIIYLPLAVSFSNRNFLVSSCGLFFSA